MYALLLNCSDKGTDHHQGRNPNVIEREVKKSLHTPINLGISLYLTLFTPKTQSSVKFCGRVNHFEVWLCSILTRIELIGILDYDQRLRGVFDKLQYIQ